MPENKDPDLYLECGTPANVGDKAFNYYDFKVGTIGNIIRHDGWFDFKHDDGTSALLNNERVCSLLFANKKGWLKNAE